MTLQDLILPENDRNIIVAIHYYSPGQFTNQGVPWSAKNKDNSGIEWTNTVDEENSIISDFEMDREWSEKTTDRLRWASLGPMRKPIWLHEKDGPVLSPARLKPVDGAGATGNLMVILLFIT